MQIACCIANQSTFELVRKTLEHARFACQRFETDISLVRAVRTGKYQMVLIDNHSVQDLDPWLHSYASAHVPVMMLCENRDIHAVIRALESGVDDVMHGEVEPKELLARIGAVMRRHRRIEGSDVIDMHGYRLEHATGTILDRGVPIKLTPKEFSLAWLLFSFAGAPIPREKICIAIWGLSSQIGCRTFEQHIYKLRKKLGLSRERGVWIQTVYNEGVCLRLPDGGHSTATTRPDEHATYSNIFTPPARLAPAALLSH